MPSTPIVTDRSPTASVERWQKLDQQTVTVVNEAGQRSVDHSASASANVKAATTHLRNAFTLDKFESTGSGGGTLGPSLKVIMAPWLAAAEVLDVVAAPVKIGKNISDAVAHRAFKLF